MGRGKIKKVKPVSLQARKAAIAQQQQLQAQKAALERQIAEERSKQARLQREIEEKERLVRGLESFGAAQEARVFGREREERQRRGGEYDPRYPSPSSSSSIPQPQPPSDPLVPISDKALSMLNHMLGNRGLMQRDPATGAIDVVLNPESLASDPNGAADSGFLDGMNGAGEANAETREALAEAMAAMKAAAHVAKALPLMMLKTAAQAMTATGPGPGSATSQTDAQMQTFLTGTDGQMVIDPSMMDEHLSEFRAMMEDPEERARLGVGFEMLGWAMGEHPGQGQAQGQGQGGKDSGPLPTLEDMLKLPIFNNEAFRSSPMFGKPAQSSNRQTQQPHPTSELFLESSDTPTPMDLHNLDLMSDFLSSAPGMLSGPMFGGAAGSGAPMGMVMGVGVSMPLRQGGSAPPPPPPPPPRPADPEYPGDLTASEAVKAVTQLLEASSRKLQKVTEDQQGTAATDGKGKNRHVGVDSMNIRLDRAGNQSSSPGQQIGHSDVPLAAAHAILQARARDGVAPDVDEADIDAISVEGDVEAFDDNDNEEEYYSDEEYYDDEEYDEEDGVAYITDEEETDEYSNAPSDDAGSFYDSEEEDDERYPAAEVMPFHAPVRRKRNSDSTSGSVPRDDPSMPPRPHYSTIPYLPGSRRNPVTGKQMREILDRLSPAARHNYQQALIREHQLEMEMEKREGQQEQIPPQQEQQIPLSQSVPPMNDQSQDQAVDELFSWIKAVIWTIEQHAIRAARAQMEAKGVGGKPGVDAPPAAAAGKGKTGPATWTPKATPDGERMRAMMRTVGIDVAPA